RPKRLLKGHLDRSTFRQFPENTFCREWVGHWKNQLETLGLVVPVGRLVPTHDHDVAYSERGVIDLVTPVGRRIGDIRRLAPCEHEGDRSIQAPFIACECGLAGPVEG